MLSHAMIGIGDFDRAYSFYAAIAAELGLKPFFSNPAAGSADGNKLCVVCHTAV
jgi:hypothetical protein